MNSEHDLSTHLSREAERFDRLGGSTLELGQVLDRAGEIRRGRRMRATIMMAAVVVAVAVPTALVATNGHHDKPVTPAHHTRTDTSPLSLDRLAQGDEPGSGFLEGAVFHRGATAVSFEALGGHRWPPVTSSRSRRVETSLRTTSTRPAGPGPRSG
jgi:hypothetical protein